jgi:signal transduction histidine kinase/ligand-binding sensor domain-containing protein
MNNRKFSFALIPLFYFVLILLLQYSCRPGSKPVVNKKITTQYQPPKVTVLAQLPDSLQPTVVYIDKMPKPQTITVPTKAGGSYINKTDNQHQVVPLYPPAVHSFIDPITKKPLSMEEQGIGSFKNYTSDDGLMIDDVLCVLIDIKGNLWFGSGNGISRYDGKKFSHFTHSNGLAAGYVRRMIEDHNGNLWMAIEGGGVSKFDGKIFTNFNTKNGLIDENVYGLTEDKKGNMWFATGQGISKYDGVQFNNYTTEQGLPLNHIWAIIADRSGNIWCTTDGKGVCKFDGKNFKTYTTEQGLAHNDAFDVMEDSNGNIWFSTMGGGVSRYDGNEFVNYSTKQGLAHDYVLSIEEDNEKNIWIGTYGGGVSKYDGNKIINLRSNNGLAGKSVSSITKDKKHNIWFGIYGGLSKYTGNNLLTFNSNHGINSVIYNSLKDSKNTFWFSTTNGLIRYNDSHFNTYTVNQGLANNNDWGLLEDNIGNIWIGSDGGGVSKFDGKRFTNYTTAQGLSSNYIVNIIEDKSNNIWFGTRGGGLCKYDGQKYITYSLKQGLPEDNIEYIFEDIKGNIWFCGIGNGVSMFDGKRIINFSTESGLASNDVTSISGDTLGNIWACTLRGLSVIRHQKLLHLKDSIDKIYFEDFIDKDGILKTEINILRFNDNGNLIIGSKEGLIIVKKGLQALSDEEPMKIFEGEVALYGNKTGYALKNIYTILSEDQGALWLDGYSNKACLVRFDYNSLPPKDTTKPIVEIQKIKINNEAISWNTLLEKETEETDTNSTNTTAYITEEMTTFNKKLSDEERKAMQEKFGKVRFDSVRAWYPVPENLVLPYAQNNISFDFNAIETGRNFMVRYQYKLDGYDKDWSPITELGSANFGNIGEGNYTFNLKARSPEGIWSDPIKYNFSVLPPWYRTWWAYLIYLTTLGLALGKYVQFRSRRLYKENIALEEKVNLRTSELNQSLVDLKTTQAQLIQSEKMAGLGELTAGIAHEIQNPLNFVNNFSEVSTELVNEMNEEIDKGNLNDTKEIALDLKVNLEKINHHGKRASDIVKGMLEHSRKSTGEKSPTDINKLCDEYIRLSYHGLRAKDKSFNADFSLDLESNLPMINVVSQDIGRVLLNIFTNAFQACHERKTKENNLNSDGIVDISYKPNVAVKTERLASKVIITITDNGGGMSNEVKDKIFQPFYTTKPTGQGTGLGLSLAYDIVRAHGGILDCKSEVGVGTSFVLQLVG